MKKHIHFVCRARRCFAAMTYGSCKLIDSWIGVMYHILDKISTDLHTRIKNHVMFVNWWRSHERYIISYACGIRLHLKRAKLQNSISSRMNSKHYFVVLLVSFPPKTKNNFVKNCTFHFRQKKQACKQVQINENIS